MRTIGTFGLIGLFLLASQDLRETAMEGIRTAVFYVQHNSPYSYIALGVLAAFLFARALSSKPHESSVA